MSQKPMAFPWALNNKLGQIGLVLRAVRFNRQFKQEDLAKHLDMGKQTINAMEYGRHNYRIGSLLRVCEGLGVPLVQVVNPSEANATGHLTYSQLRRAYSSFQAAYKNKTTRRPVYSDVEAPVNFWDQFTNPSGGGGA